MFADPAQVTDLSELRGVEAAGAAGIDVFDAGRDRQPAQRRRNCQAMPSGSFGKLRAGSYRQDDPRRTDRGSELQLLLEGQAMPATQLGVAAG